MKLLKSLLAGLILGTATLPVLESPAKAELTLVGVGIEVARTAAKMYWNDVGRYIQVCNSASRAREGQRVIREVREAVGEADIVRKSIRLAEWKNASSMQKKCFYGLTNNNEGRQLQRAVARLESSLQRNISAGNFKFNHHPAIYYSNGQGRYCWFDNWDNFVRLTGGNTTWRNIPRTLKDYSMTYDGICTGGASKPAPHPDPNNS